MTLEAESVGSVSVTDGDVVAAIDEIGGQPHLVIADIGRDDVWLSMTERDAVSLDEWR
ncbi:hypothetical protein Htur_1490 [Haloterrigena turkmenica DSM 5511]|uniref:Uncharacterized protein n=1 Tax=Haloterrigena turkmenica (strain ATCC 51198 / DSM 5511 / JCM 9101 / NCIMB 13204 / VKM B-1734 / 4k) TaxID=543526 RepID=D2RQP5_HALTV|nr:hypothetical protein [Haloterrigena turkmenica]ADB60376.1 hypothetical protein Htur_1490 [Haloterrigena turkmenica DSM 5511]